MNNPFHLSCIKKIYTKHKIITKFTLLLLLFIITKWIWHYSNHEDGELKLYSLQAIAEIIVAILETVATFLMITSLKQNREANREIKKMNESLQASMKAQTDVLIKQQEFYALQTKEKLEEIQRNEKTKIFNRYLSYVRNFLFAYNRGKFFDGISTKQLQIYIHKNIQTENIKECMLKNILDIKLTPNQNIEQYIFTQTTTNNKTNKTIEKIIFTHNDKDVKERFDCLLREYRYKLKSKLDPILKDYFIDFNSNDELQELCG